MANPRKHRAIISSFEVDRGLHDRMTRNVDSDVALLHVKAKRSPWLRAAIAEKCERQESGNGKGGE